eukprot:CAMPEP_0114591650 /NCGR_PEP_ID=MMETSP0125-20121206/13647_1 /TAXON_ID=485358 ORGANISM="Aristerostoma sp., Strain ATCC 50986" /NCGR_SAMPLE_ID=MMETSP0125 /ASSEMBLY_ACC=CAM_ASM_000245 /LENGTH=54 /DNA_ID=CAMNT_0001789847 /DNA_START=25 /DNA_END=189 /DNA_ORIENTATION=+
MTKHKIAESDTILNQDHSPFGQDAKRTISNELISSFSISNTRGDDPGTPDGKSY